MLGEYEFSEEKLKDAIGILPLKTAAYNIEKSAQSNAEKSQSPQTNE